MSLRNGKVKSDIPPPKRQYNKAKPQAKPQEEPSDDESITLALEESFENIAVSEIETRVEIETRDEIETSEDNLTLDEYDRPKCVNKKYLFDKEMLPSLRKVKFYLLTHFYSTLN